MDTQVKKFTDFAKLVRKAVIETFGEQTIGFVAAYPRGEQNFPLITYRLLKSEPGQFGRDKEIKPRLRETLNTQLGVTEVWAQRKNYVVQFDIWAADGQTADEVVESFEGLISQYTGSFKQAGVVEILWLGQNNLATASGWEASVSMDNRTVSYLVVIEDVTLVTYSDITSVTTKTQVGTQEQDETIINTQGG